jgi:FtsP/CotA-like multicopper oxidase with cupredoxin domain
MYRVLRSWHVDCLIWLLVCSIADAATRKYDFTISRGMISPDGTKKLALLVNNQYPGPTIEANWKDTIEVTVHNRIAAPGEGTSLHWHGFFQKGTPWSDGVPAVNQCPIPPGDSYTYSFVADQYGTSWYHSHFSAQYTDGALGPIVIHGYDETLLDGYGF